MDDVKYFHTTTLQHNKAVNYRISCNAKHNNSNILAAVSITDQFTDIVDY